MFNYFKKKAITDRSNDELLYEYVLEEIENSVKVKGLWAKAYANSDGNENNIEPLYMKYRVQSIKDAFSILQISYNEYKREQLFNFIKNKLFNEVENISLDVTTKMIPSKSKAWKMLLNDGYTKFGPTTFLQDKKLDMYVYKIEDNAYIIYKGRKEIKRYYYK